METPNDTRNMVIPLNRARFQLQFTFFYSSFYWLYIFFRVKQEAAYYTYTRVTLKVMSLINFYRNATRDAGSTMPPFDRESFQQQRLSFQHRRHYWQCIFTKMTPTHRDSKEKKKTSNKTFSKIVTRFVASLI